MHIEVFGSVWGCLETSRGPYRVWANIRGPIAVQTPVYGPLEARAPNLLRKASSYTLLCMLKRLAAFGSVWGCLGTSRGPYQV